MTNEPLIRYLSTDDAGAELRRASADAGASEIACVRNLEYRFTPFELYPLAPRTPPPLERVVAFVVDMDGTSTTTEPLALHALEYMVRRMTGRLDRSAWPGLDPQHDHPFVIGNSNYRHAEFLVQRYRERIQHAALRDGFFEALCWTLANMRGTPRADDVTRNARHCGLEGLLADAEFRRLVEAGSVDAEDVARRVAPFVTRHGAAFRCDHTGALVSAALDIYYMRYHSLLRQVEHGQAERLERELLADRGRHLIEAMPGYDVFVPLVRGWLGGAARELFEPLCAHLSERPDAAALNAARERLIRTALYFERHPARLALVTASIAYEAHAVMKEVIRRMQERVAPWPIPTDSREGILARLADYRTVFDAFVNASHACEHRLKPHPDLYSLALRFMSVPREQYRFVIGLEDTEPGVVALRAAGVGCVVALPNRDTSRQNYSAAARIVHGGLPELLLMNDLVAPAVRGPAGAEAPLQAD